MQFGADDLVHSPLRGEADARLDVLIVYEDMPAGKKAKEICDKLAKRLGAPWRVNINLFNFECLHHPSVGAAASESDLVVFSCRDRSLPARVRDWIESCLVRPALPAALVALLAISPCARGDRGAAGQHLAAAAHRCGMRFFSTTYSLRNDRQTDSFRKNWPI